MANPRLPHISEAEEAVLYAKLNEYNRKRASFKEAGAYLVVLPYPGHDCYSVWIFSPLPQRQAVWFIHDLSPDINEALRMASTMFYFSARPLLIVDYNEKRMQSNGDDIVSFGKYHGHYLYEILKVDPTYLSWIGYKYTPRIPKQERFVKIAQVYHSVHLDLMQRKAQQKKETGRFLGEAGETLKDLTLKVMRVRLEDDPYRTQVKGSRVQFYVQQIIHLVDPVGNRTVMKISSKSPSQASCQLSAFDHEYTAGEIVHIASARVLRTYESNGSKFTRLSHVQFYKVSV